MTMDARASLPDPDPAALERSNRIAAALRSAIGAAAGGCIGFERYMDIVLYTPGDGYYAAGEPIFGRDGDFITAPEVGELFGACLARQCAEVLACSGHDIVEYGAGSGQLAVQLCAALMPLDDELRYTIVEPSEGLARVQQQLISRQLPDFANRVSWLAEPPDAPVKGVLIANEVVDALPARRYRVDGQGYSELGVGIESGTFAWQTLAPRSTEAGMPGPDVLQTLGDGYCFELTTALDAWLASLRGALDAGAVFIIDYGEPRHEFFHPSRTAGSLRCFYRHRVHDDPFVWPGLQDITVSVDFTRLAELADAAGFRIAGYCSQTAFLLGCGLESILQARMSGLGSHDYALAQEAKRLLMPDEMGQRFKVMGLAVDYDAPMSGFRQDERHRLEGFTGSPGARP